MDAVSQFVSGGWHEGAEADSRQIGVAEIWLHDAYMNSHAKRNGLPMDRQAIVSFGSGGTQPSQIALSGGGIARSGPLNPKMRETGRP